MIATLHATGKRPVDDCTTGSTIELTANFHTLQQSHARTLSNTPATQPPCTTSMTLTSLTLTPHKTIVSPTSSTVTTSPPERATLESILKLEEIDPLLYRGYSPAIPRYGRVFGGQTVAQSLVAAVKTVDSRFRLHSLHW